MAVSVYQGGTIVTSTGIIENGTIVVEEGKISEIQPGTRKIFQESTDLKGSLVIPGIIDTHSDAIEVEVQPRPGSVLPMEIAFSELERKLAGQGITTIHHALSMLGDQSDKWTRTNETAKQLIDTILSMSKERQLIHHCVHLRFDITNLSAFEDVKALISAGKLQQLSFNDHTPGQGQYRDLEFRKQKLMRDGVSEAESEQIIAEKLQRPKLALENLMEVADLAALAGIPIASHDDDSIEKIQLVQDNLYATISEFPVAMDAAKEAKKRGMHVVMGAPNVLLGRSHSNNLSALEAIKEGIVDVLCSDYYPPSLLQSVFLLHQQGFPLNEAVNMVSLNPAKALQVDDQKGSLQIGKDADFLIVKESKYRPVIEKVIVGGNTVCRMDYRKHPVQAV